MGSLIHTVRKVRTTLDGYVTCALLKGTKPVGRGTRKREEIH